VEQTHTSPIPAAIAPTHTVSFSLCTATTLTTITTTTSSYYKPIYSIPNPSGDNALLGPPVFLFCSSVAVDEPERNERGRTKTIPRVSPVVTVHTLSTKPEQTSLPTITWNRSTTMVLSPDQLISIPSVPAWRNTSSRMYVCSNSRRRGDQRLRQTVDRIIHDSTSDMTTSSYYLTVHAAIPGCTTRFDECLWIVRVHDSQLGSVSYRSTSANENYT
jgi:hypothetical protein